MSDPTAPLGWSGYSEFGYESLAGRAEELSRPEPRYAAAPLFAETLPAVAGLEAAARVEAQRRFLDRIDHSKPLSIHSGLVGASLAARVRGELQAAFQGLLAWIRAGAPDDDALVARLEARRPGDGRRFRSVLRSSRFRHGPIPDGFFERKSLYAECGVDLMMGPLGPVLSEFQLGAHTYPHFIDLGIEAFAEAFPEVARRHGVAPDGYTGRRRALIARARDGHLRGTPAGRARALLVDAWTKDSHRGANYRVLAEELGLEYLLFDHLRRDLPLYGELRSGADRVFVFNQPPGYLLDPVEPAFAPMNAEHIEEYPELGWPGLHGEYVSGRAYLTTSPFCDVLNDKGIYPYVPGIVEHYAGRALALPICDARPAWSLEDPGKPDPALLEWLRRHRADAVIAHRYVEGGIGIQVGAYLGAEEWEAFIRAHLIPRPDLFVVRPFYEMEPVHSIRLLACGLAGPAAEGKAPEVTTGSHFFGRLTFQRSVDNVASGGHCFIAAASSDPGYSGRFEQRLKDLRAQYPDALRHIPV